MRHQHNMLFVRLSGLTFKVYLLQCASRFGDAGFVDSDIFTGQIHSENDYQIQ